MFDDFLKNIGKHDFVGKLRFNEKLVYKLLKARQDKVLEHLRKLGIELYDGDTVEKIRGRMELAGVSLETVKNSEDNPRENFIVIMKRGNPIVAISEPFIDGQNIMVRVVDPGVNRLVLNA